MGTMGTIRNPSRERAGTIHERPVQDRFSVPGTVGNRLADPYRLRVPEGNSQLAG